ncbi:MAG: type IV pilus biogenesis/stability protein PilW [Gammaproteobacteria bacterium]
MIYRMYVVLLSLLLLSACAGSGISPVSNYDEGEYQPSYDPNPAAEANLRLGVAYMRDGNYERALERLKRSRDMDPEYPQAYNYLGLLHQRMRQPQEAEKNFKKALSLAPNDSTVLNTYGQFLCSQQRHEEGIKAFARARSNPLYDTPEIAMTNAGTCSLEAGNTAEAEKFFREALEVRPDIPTALLQMADISYNNGEYLSARGYLQRYLAVAPYTARSLWLGIRIERELGDADTVSSYVLLLRSSFPDSSEAAQVHAAGIR